MAYVLQELGAPAVSDERLRRFVGPPLLRNLEDVFGAGDPRVEEGLKLFKKRFSDEGIPMYTVYPGIRALLEGLRETGVVLAVATSKFLPIAQRILDEHDLTRLFEHVAATPLDMIWTKSQVVKDALEALDMPDPASVVMVGDREHDVIGAKANGVSSIGVLYGYGDRAELEAAGATHVADSVTELRQILL
jgi:phosphoglycolate phosphatase